MKCPRCGANTAVKNTIERDGIIRRRRRCEEHGDFWTVEELVEKHTTFSKEYICKDTVIASLNDLKKRYYPPGYIPNTLPSTPRQQTCEEIRELIDYIIRHLDKVEVVMINEP